MALYAGIDGGGTKTQIFLLDTAEQRAVSRFGGASNPSSVGWETAVKVVVELLQEGLAELGYSEPDVQSLCAAMAGMDRPEQAQRMREDLKQAFPNTHIQVVNDALGALSAGTRGESGVVLIAGTGSIAVGETRQGSVVRSGGYGYLIGDEGSGLAIGRMGLMAAIAAYEKRAPDSELWPQAASFFAVRHPQEIIPKVYGASHPVGLIASFAKTVVTLAETDDVARGIIEEALANYQGLVDSVFAQVAAKNGRVPVAQAEQMVNHVVLAGGLFTGTPYLAERLAKRMPLHTFTTLQHSPAAGAALRALRHSRLPGLPRLPGDSEAADDAQQAISIWESTVGKHEQALKMAHASGEQ